MKKIIFLFALACLFAQSSIAQTKLIAYRSHSGNTAAFALNETDNLGMPSDPYFFLTPEEKDSVRKEQEKLRLKDSINRKNYIDSIDKKNKAKPKGTKKQPEYKTPTGSTAIEKQSIVQAGQPVKNTESKFPSGLLLLVGLPAGILAMILKRV